MSIFITIISLMRILLFILIVTIAYADGANWAVLVAGSNTYYNYRHQADVCHAYQIIHENNIPDSNIIVMMYDDIAHNSMNPYKGIIINQPGGPNVYKGVPKDYTRNHVNPKNFMAVLKGNQSAASGRVLQSGPDDNVFIYFTDHGGPGLICFPNEYLYSHDLIATLKYMHAHKKYKNLVFYLEACESGSMFNNILPKNMSIYALTAATPTEDSWACYLDNYLQTYIADCFSENWLMNSNSYENDANETLKEQFLIVRNETINSTACHYGQNNMLQMPLGDFIIQNVTRHIRNKKTKIPKIVDAVNSKDIKLSTLTRLYANSKNNKRLDNEIKHELESRKFYDNMFKEHYNQMKGSITGCYPNTTIDTYCLKRHIDGFESMYGKFSEYGMKYVSVLANMYCKTH